MASCAVDALPVRSVSPVVERTDEAIAEHIESQDVRSRVPDYRASYHRDHYVELPAFMPATVWSRAYKELRLLFPRAGRRRDVLIAQSAYTPRAYSNLGRDAIAMGSLVIPALFKSRSLYRFLEEVVGQTVMPIPYMPEEYVASRLHRVGDTHGWHWDDYTWALVWIFDMPDVENGGSLEYVQDAEWNRSDPRIAHFVSTRPVRRRHPGPGSAYLLKANTCLHRVSPLRHDTERMIVCYSFASEADLTKRIDHQSMEALYPQAMVLQE